MSDTYEPLPTIIDIDWVRNHMPFLASSWTESDLQEQIDILHYNEIMTIIDLHNVTRGHLLLMGLNRTLLDHLKPVLDPVARIDKLETELLILRTTLSHLLGIVSNRFASDLVSPSSSSSSSSNHGHNTTPQSPTGRWSFGTPNPSPLHLSTPDSQHNMALGVSIHTNSPSDAKADVLSPKVDSSDQAF